MTGGSFVEPIEMWEIPHSYDQMASVGKCKSTGVDVDICYDTFGCESDPCVLLVMAMGLQGVAWPNEFCVGLAKKGFYVVRYDNRDTGKSTHFNQCGAQFIARYVLPQWASIGERVPYTLEDMAADGMGLLRFLGIRKAHLVGRCMGGMIAQLMAIDHPKKFLSLTLIHSTVGGRDDVNPSLFQYRTFLSFPLDKSFEALVERRLRAAQRLRGSIKEDDDEARAMIRMMLLRGDDSSGKTRQVAAVKRAHSRLQGLKNLKIPTLVLHGDMDELIPLKNGVKLAKAIKNAKLVVVPNMGHTLPTNLIPFFVSEVLDVMSHSTDVPNDSLLLAK